MNLLLLRIFSAVAEHGGFSRAATAVFIGQPAVSKAVRQLEHQLDLPRIERGAGGRGAKGVRLTESDLELSAFPHRDDSSWEVHRAARGRRQTVVGSTTSRPLSAQELPSSSLFECALSGQCTDSRVPGREPDPAGVRAGFSTIVVIAVAKRDTRSCRRRSWFQPSRCESTRVSCRKCCR